MYRDTVTPVLTETGGYIMIMAAIGGGPNCNIAVDDITLRYGACIETTTVSDDDDVDVAAAADDDSDDDANDDVADAAIGGNDSANDDTDANGDDTADGMMYNSIIIIN